MREREALGNVVRKGRGGQFSEDRVFLSFSSLQCGRPPSLCLHAVAARKGAGVCISHEQAAHSQLSQGKRLQDTSPGTARTSPDGQNGEGLI